MNEKDTKQIFTFDANDTLGYLVPGLTVVMGIYIHYCKFFGIQRIKEEAGAVLPLLVKEDFEWHESLIAITIILYVGYMIGHLIATFSSIIMDKLLVERIFGYPYERLFKGQLGPQRLEKHKRAFYKVALAFFVVELIWIAWTGPYNLVSLLLVIGICIFLGFKFGYTVLNQRDWQDQYDLRDEHDLQPRIAEWCWRYLFRWWLVKFGPMGSGVSGVVFDWWANLLLSLLRMRKPFSEKFRQSFVTKFKQVFGLKAEEVGTDVYWLTYSYLCQNKPACTKLLHKWLGLYGFTRNLATAFFLLFVYTITINTFYQPTGPYLAWCVVTGVAAVIFGLRYFYLYYNYYSKFVFRAFMSEKIVTRDSHIVGSELALGSN